MLAWNSWLGTAGLEQLALESGLFTLSESLENRDPQA